jgi:hypothetical protein
MERGSNLPAGSSRNGKIFFLIISGLFALFAGLGDSRSSEALRFERGEASSDMVVWVLGDKRYQNCCFAGERDKG